MDNQKKKVLIITYYWPPAGGPGVQRWLKFVKYLPDFDIHPIVYLPKNPNYPLIDEKLLEDIPTDCTIIKRSILEPYAWASFLSKKDTKKMSSGIITKSKKQSFLQKVMLWIRGNLFIPDARVLWVKPSIKYLEKYIIENKVDIIITSGPPHSLHLIGLGLKQKLNIKWIADFRDPWTTIGYHKELKLSKRAEDRHEKLEKKVLNSCDTVLVTSHVTKKEFEKITAKPIAVITNGYDNEAIEKKPLDEKFTLAHIGSFLSNRNPKILWECLSELITENKQFAEKFQLKLIGAISEEVLQSIDQFELNNFVLNLGYVSHAEAVSEQRASQVLLLIEIDSEETKCIIPGKLFEYMISNRPIIAIGPTESDVENIIKETNTGNYFLYKEKIQLKKTILNLFELYIKNELQSYPINLQQFSRQNLTKKLAELLKK